MHLARLEAGRGGCRRHPRIIACRDADARWIGVRIALCTWASESRSPRRDTIRRPSDRVTVLVYSNSARGAGGGAHRGRPPPRPGLPAASTGSNATRSQQVVGQLDQGGLDLVILDGEAQPTGGMGLARQFKYEYRRLPADRRRDRPQAGRLAGQLVARRRRDRPAARPGRRRARRRRPVASQRRGRPASCASARVATHRRAAAGPPLLTALTARRGARPPRTPPGRWTRSWPARRRRPSSPRSPCCCGPRARRRTRSPAWSGRCWPARLRVEVRRPRRRRRRHRRRPRAHRQHLHDGGAGGCRVGPAGRQARQPRRDVGVRHRRRARGAGRRHRPAGRRRGRDGGRGRHRVLLRARCSTPACGTPARRGANSASRPSSTSSAR